MVRLNRVVPEGAATVLVKLEMQNPGGSVKDRIALSTIEEAEKRGDISPGKTTIVERTSGNTGIGLAMVAAAKGYRCILIMPQVPSMYERYILCRKFGCEVHLTSVLQDDFSRTLPFMLDHLNALLKENPDYWTPYQFESDDNPLAHLTTTAPEIWEQTGGVCDAFVAGAGTGGTLNGCARYLKEKNADCHVVCVEPSESRVMVGAEAGMHGVVGIGTGQQLPLIEKLAPGQAWAVRGAARRHRRVLARVDARRRRLRQPPRGRGGSARRPVERRRHQGGGRARAASRDEGQCRRRAAGVVGDPVRLAPDVGGREARGQGGAAAAARPRDRAADLPLEVGGLRAAAAARQVSSLHGAREAHAAPGGDCARVGRLWDDSRHSIVSCVGVRHTPVDKMFRCV